MTRHDYVAMWVGVLEGWRGERNISCNRADLRHLIAQLQGWCESETMFIRAPTVPTTAAKPSAQQDQRGQVGGP